MRKKTSCLLKGIIIVFLILFQLSAIGQNKSSNQEEAWWDVYYGYRVSNRNFYNQLNTINSFKFGSPLQTVGVRWKIFFGTHHRIFKNGHIGYSQILPQTIVIQDTLKGKITGGFFNFAFGYYIKTKAVNLMVYLGFNTGQLNIYKNDLIRQKNPTFSPKVGIQPWFRFKKFAITPIVEYEYDISKTKWKQTWFFKSENIVGIAPLRQSALTVQIGLNFDLGK